MYFLIGWQRRFWALHLQGDPIVSQVPLGQVAKSLDFQPFLSLEDCITNIILSLSFFFFENWATHVKLKTSNLRQAEYHFVLLVVDFPYVSKIHTLLTSPLADFTAVFFIFLKILTGIYR